MLAVFVFLAATISVGDRSLREWATHLFSLMVGWAAASIWKKQP